MLRGSKAGYDGDILGRKDGAQTLESIDNSPFCQQCSPELPNIARTAGLEARCTNSRGCASSEAHSAHTPVPCLVKTR
ncbi:hypothetical protein C8T65DRAFT_173721 [Cerioporus squamosus]|nr:hypothetical protein C8T65DRAFT_173721 [Cerioporus squamosus]